MGNENSNKNLRLSHPRSDELANVLKWIFGRMGNILKSIFLILMLAFHLPVFINCTQSLFQPDKACLNYFDEPAPLLFSQYQLTPLHLQLKQWRIANEHKSMAHVRYAEKPKNPE